MQIAIAFKFANVNLFKACSNKKYKSLKRARILIKKTKKKLLVTFDCYKQFKVFCFLNLIRLNVY